MGAGWSSALAVACALAGCGRLEFASSQDASVDADTGADAGGAAAVCNSVSRLADDFEDGVDADRRWTASFADPGTSYAEAGGDLVITPATSTADAYAGYQTSLFYDLHGGRVWTELSQLPAAGVEAGLAVGYANSTYVHFAVESGMLRATQGIEGTSTVLLQAAYDPTLRFLAIREDRGQLVFELSADGVTFTPWFASAAPFDVSLVTFYVFAGTASAVATPGVARFAAIRGQAVDAAASPACPVTALTDAFEDGVTDRRWARSYTDPCCTQAETGGRLELTSDGTPGFVARRSAAAYSLRDAAVTWTVPTGPQAGSGVYADVGLQNGDSRVALQITDTQLGCWVRVGTLPSDDTQHARDQGEIHFRIRDAAGQLSFESSKDRVTWRLLRELPAPFPIDEVTVKLELGGGATTAASAASFDDLGGP